MAKSVNDFEETSSDIDITDEEIMENLENISMDNNEPMTDQNSIPKSAVDSKQTAEDYQLSKSKQTADIQETDEEKMEDFDEISIDNYDPMANQNSIPILGKQTANYQLSKGKQTTNLEESNKKFVDSDVEMVYLASDNKDENPKIEKTDTNTVKTSSSNLRSIRKRRKYQCTFCQKLFGNEIILKTHIKSAHSLLSGKKSTGELFECKSCAKIFRERFHGNSEECKNCASKHQEKIVDISNDDEGEENIEILRENEENFSSTTKSIDENLRQNENTTIDDQEETGKVVKLDSIINDMFKNISNAGSDTNSECLQISCNRCDTIFKTQKGLTDHEKYMQNPVKQCMICPFKSCSRTSLLMHMEKIHTS